MITLLYLSVSIVVNLREEVFAYKLGLDKGWGFWLLVLTYSLFLFLYSVWVCGVYLYWYGTKRRWKHLWWNIGYVLFAMVPPILLNTVLLQVLVMPLGKNVFLSDYWSTDFPYFGIPLALYTIAVAYWPAVRISSVLPKFRDTDRRVLLLLWHDHYDMRYLRTYLWEVMGSRATYVDGKVRLLDILLIGYENKSFYFILTNGEKLMTTMISKDFVQWPLWSWFFTTNRDTYINMLYIDDLKGADRTLVLSRRLRHTLRRSRYYPTIQGALHISRAFIAYYPSFVERIPTLPEKGWEEMVDL